MNRPELWVCRHGETDWSRDLKHTGTTGVALTDVGEQQAQALAARLAGEQFDLVLVSPRRRAVDTPRRRVSPMRSRSRRPWSGTTATTRA